MNDKDQAYRDASFLVLKSAAALPRRCYKCNSAEIAAIKIDELEHTPLLEDLLEFAVNTALPIGSESLSPNRQKLELEVFCCRRHRSFHQALNKVGWVIVIFSAVCFVLSILTRSYFDTFAISGIILIVGVSIGSILLYVAKDHQLVAKHRYQDHYFWVKGFGDAYLASFPNLPR